MARSRYRALVVAATVLFTVAFTAVTAPRATAQSFTDVPKTYWAYSAITSITDRSAGGQYLMDDYGTTFEPNTPLTRELLARALVVASGHYGPLSHRWPSTTWPRAIPTTTSSRWLCICATWVSTRAVTSIRPPPSRRGAPRLLSCIGSRASTRAPTGRCSRLCILRAGSPTAVGPPVHQATCPTSWPRGSCSCATTTPQVPMISGYAQPAHRPRRGGLHALAGLPGPQRVRAVGLADYQA